MSREGKSFHQSNNSFNRKSNLEYGSMCITDCCLLVYKKSLSTGMRLPSHQQPRDHGRPGQVVVNGGCPRNSGGVGGTP